MIETTEGNNSKMVITGGYSNSAGCPPTWPQTRDDVSTGDSKQDLFVERVSDAKHLVFSSVELLMSQNMVPGLVNIEKTMENLKITMLLMGKSTISMAIFNSYMLNYQKVYQS